MYRIQVFDEEHEDDLSEKVNAFLSTNEHIDLFDIKFSTAFSCVGEEQIYCFSALLIYRDKESENYTY